MQRIALKATLDTPLGLIRVTTTPLEYYSRRQRAAQIERLRDLHQEAVAQARSPRPGALSDGPFCAVPRAAASILTGDFNCRPESPFTFDFIFVSEDLAPRVQDMRVDPTSDASDHQAMLLVLA